MSGSLRRPERLPETMMIEEKLTRMRADTFRARLRLGLGFPAAVHVPEGLKIRDTDVETLCDILCVDGDLDLAGCVNLRELPARLVVRGNLKLDGCGRLEALPATVREVFGFSAVGCGRLASIGSIVECRGWIDLTGCERLEPLARGFRAEGRAVFSGCQFHPDYLRLPAGMPESVILALPGRRIGDVLGHRLLAGHPVLDAVISDAREAVSSPGLWLDADCTALVRADAKPAR